MNEFDSVRVDQIFESGNRIASKCLVSAGCQSSATLTCDVIVFFFFHCSHYQNVRNFVIVARLALKVTLLNIETRLVIIYSCATLERMESERSGNSWDCYLCW